MCAVGFSWIPEQIAMRRHLVLLKGVERGGNMVGTGR